MCLHRVIIIIFTNKDYNGGHPKKCRVWVLKQNTLRALFSILWAPVVVLTNVDV